MVQPPFPEFLPESSWRPPDSFPDLTRAKWLSIDCETKDPNLREKGPGFVRGDAFVAGVAIHADGFSGYYPVRHLTGCNLAPNVVFQWLADQAKAFVGELYGSNLLYDEEALWFEGVKFLDEVKRRDIQIVEPLLDAETTKGYSLEVLSQKYLDQGKEESLLREAASMHTKGWKDKRSRRPIPFDPKGDLWKLAPEYVGEYAEGDVDRPRRIYQEQLRVIEQECLHQILALESSLIPILLRMRVTGVRVDLQAADDLRKRMTVEIDKYSNQIKQLVGFHPNVDSSQELAKAYRVLDLQKPEMHIGASLKYTKLGAPSFTSDWYSAQQDPLSKLIHKKKKLMTLRDDFVSGDIIKESVSGRVHPQFHQLRQDDKGTRGGRFSSTNPNLQQAPSRHDDALWGPESPIWAKDVRKLFVAEPGELMFKGDFSQQEPRPLLHFAMECNLPGSAEAVQAFKKNPRTDYHTLTTDIVNRVSGKNFKRKQIKAVNLGISYGMGIEKLSRQLGVSLAEAREIKAEYDEALPFVKGLSKKAMSVVSERGYLSTLLKRRQRFDLWEFVPNSVEERAFKPRGLPRDEAEATWPGRKLQRSGIHKALNTLIQGSAADQTKEAMRQLYYNHGIVLQLVVHDEGVKSVVSMDEAKTIKRVMETCVVLHLPVVCDAVVGPSWGGASEEVSLAA